MLLLFLKWPPPLIFHQNSKPISALHFAAPPHGASSANAAYTKVVTLGTLLVPVEAKKSRLYRVGPTPSESVEKRPQNGCYSCQWNCVTYLAHGLIFSARPRLIQNPAPPVANQNFVDILKIKKDKTSLYYPFFFYNFFSLDQSTDRLTEPSFLTLSAASIG